LVKKGEAEVTACVSFSALAKLKNLSQLSPRFSSEISKKKAKEKLVNLGKWSLRQNAHSRKTTVITYQSTFHT